MKQRNNRRTAYRDARQSARISKKACSFSGLTKSSSLALRQQSTCATLLVVQVRAYGQPESKTMFQHVDQPRHPAELMFRNGLRACKADSGTFYIPDPYWTNTLRLVLMPNVRFVEPMFGFLSPAEALRTITDGPDEAQIIRYRHTFRPKQSPRTHMQLTGSFADREGLAVAVRVKGRANGRANAVMFANFCDPEASVHPSTLHELEMLFHDMLESVSSIARHIEHTAPFPVADLVCVLEPFSDLPGLLYAQPALSLESFMCAVLNATIRACHLDLATSFGTVHLYDPATDRLRLFSAVGACALPPKDAPGYKIFNWEGVISWVANRRRALLICDLATSEFRHFHISMNQATVCELAVPMMAGDQLVGVFNIESTHPFIVNSHSASDMVRIAWHAANQAAIACRLQRESQLLEKQKEIADKNAYVTKELLTVCANLPKFKEDNQPLNRMAQLASEVLSANRCDLWRYDTEESVFVGLGADYPEPGFNDPPRANGGWSDYVRKQNVPVWLSRISSENEFDAYSWNNDIGNWLPLKGEDTPADINRRLLTQDVGSELGLPIRMHAEAVGVAWIKYFDKTHPLPTADQVGLALGFAGECSLVSSSSQLQRESTRQTQLQTFELVIQALKHDAPDRFLGVVLTGLEGATEGKIDPVLRCQWIECLRVLRTFFWNIGVLLPSRRGRGPRHPPDLQLHNLRALLNDVVLVSDLVLNDPAVDNRVPEHAQVLCDASMTKVAMYLLIDNARKYTSPERLQPIELTFEDNVLSIRDGGMGISSELLPKIGIEIGKRRNPEGRSVSGVGFGTYLCRLLLERQSIRVQWNSDGKTGTTVAINFLGEKNGCSSCD